MKGGYHRCENDKSVKCDFMIDELKSQITELKRDYDRIYRDNKYLLGTKNFITNELEAAQDRYYDKREESWKYEKLYGKFKVRFACACGCSIYFAILWLCELFLN